MKFYAAIADTWVVGWSLSAAALADDDDDLLLFANGTDKTIPFTFHNTGLTISYNGSLVESLELAPNGLFIGAVKSGNIVPLSGELTPIPRFPVEETAFHKVSVSVPITTAIHDGFDPNIYNKAQRKQLQRLNVALKEVRAAKKLSKSQEEDI